MQHNLIERTLEFSVNVFYFGKNIPKTFEGQHVYKQLFRSATSVSANYNESQSAESPDDFVHKLQVVLKELKESLFWLEFIRKTELQKNMNNTSPLIKECKELILIIGKSIVTAKANQSNNNKNKK